MERLHQLSYILLVGLVLLLLEAGNLAFGTTCLAKGKAFITPGLAYVCQVQFGISNEAGILTDTRLYYSSQSHRPGKANRGINNCIPGKMPVPGHSGISFPITVFDDSVNKEIRKNFTTDLSPSALILTRPLAEIYKFSFYSLMVFPPGLIAYRLTLAPAQVISNSSGPPTIRAGSMCYALPAVHACANQDNEILFTSTREHGIMLPHFALKSSLEILNAIPAGFSGMMIIAIVRNGAIKTKYRLANGPGDSGRGQINYLNAFVVNASCYKWLFVNKICFSKLVAALFRFPGFSNTTTLTANQVARHFNFNRGIQLQAVGQAAVSAGVAFQHSLAVKSVLQSPGFLPMAKGLLISGGFILCTLMPLACISKRYKAKSNMGHLAGASSNVFSMLSGATSIALCKFFNATFASSTNYQVEITACIFSKTKIRLLRNLVQVLPPQDIPGLTRLQTPNLRPGFPGVNASVSRKFNLIQCL